MDDGESTPTQTARREFEEEIGLPLSDERWHEVGYWHDVPNKVRAEVRMRVRINVNVRVRAKVNVRVTCW